MSARILVVDDEANIRMMIRLALLRAGYHVEVAADGPEALAVFGNGSGWDLVLLDQRMPGMEGLEVLREMRRIVPTARIIMITAFGTIDLAVEAMKGGATDFLRKPFSTETLRGAVQAALSGTPAPPEAVPEEAPITLGLTTVNGFRVESSYGQATWRDGEVEHRFTVRPPAGESHECQVLLAPYFVELVKAHADREELPGGDRFWQALAEESLMNYLWQNADVPPDCRLRVDDLSTGLRRWVDLVLSGGEEAT